MMNAKMNRIFAENLVMEVIAIIEYVGIIVFAISGILAASEKQLDLFGGFIVAFVTALGGGTLRDLILNTEISWVLNPSYVYTVMVGATIALIFKKVLKRIRRTLFLFDTIGIALFTILGVQKAFEFNMPMPVVVILGTIAATFGGVLRDILCNEIPLIFRKQIYATACLAGALLYVGLHKIGVSENLNFIFAGGSIIIIRIVAVIKKLRLPVINENF